MHTVVGVLAVWLQCGYAIAESRTGLGIMQRPDELVCVESASGIHVGQIQDAGVTMAGPTYTGAGGVKLG